MKKLLLLTAMLLLFSACSHEADSAEPIVMRQESGTETELPAQQEAPAQKPSAPETEAEPETEPAFPVLPPSAVTESLTALGKSMQELTGTQLILVTSNGSEAELSCFERKAEKWTAVDELSALPGHVGRNGTADCHVEGDGTTPRGLFSLGFAFGNRQDPGTKLSYHPVTEYDYWVDDSRSAQYNRLVDSRETDDFQSGEHLSDYPESYAYAVLIEYNYPDAVPYAGSAIFLHCGTSATSGCVSVPEETMLRLLAWLEPGGMICIL